MFDLIPTEPVIACLWNLMFDLVICLLIELMLMVVSFSYFGHFFLVIWDTGFNKFDIGKSKA